ncbi:shikimate dehydrogenase family protein [Leucobacter denitrificans]|uniref:Shikimate dehydrogenase n=1 Tax=Leucobacter denitrificans TaxID=683042 RepID=A0A7G9S5I4_9MICO|nr:shikimate dehydrogenase [Leucobacter denitrificans]QNN63109.1 shikimate dehydrogenase [Leucobacter denitrificans]
MTERGLSDEELRRPAPAQLAVLGQPISHSKSPVIHRAAYSALDLPWEYEAIECGESHLADFLSSRGPEWRGFSLTMPLKDEARRLAAVVDPVAEESGVVNTLLRLTDRAGKPQWAGFNTDVAGLAAAIRRAGLDATHTVVLGAGATATSAVLAARDLGAQSVTVSARRTEAADAVVQRFPDLAQAMPLGSIPDDGSTLVISTLPGPAGASVQLPAELFSVPLFDVAYDPWPSPLAQRWREAGGEAYAGLEMLVEQALVQIRIFVQGDPNTALENEQAVLDEMRAVSVGG